MKNSKRKNLMKEIKRVNERIDMIQNYAFSATIDDITPAILVRLHREEFPDLPEVTGIENGDCIDLRSAEEVHLNKGEFKLINLGVSIQLPEGYSADLIVRSSTFKKYKILQTNSIGIIDESYCGDNDIWMLPVIATEDTVIPKNERICQFRLVKKNIPFVYRVNKLEGKDRGGFGSTGRI